VDIEHHVRRWSDSFLLTDPSGLVTYVAKDLASRLAIDGAVGRTLDELRPLITTDPRADLVTPDRDNVRHIVGRDNRELVLAVLDTDDGGRALFLGPVGERTRDEERALLDLVLSVARDAVLVTTAEPMDAPGPLIVYANPALEHHTGWTARELLGRSPRVLQGPDTDLGATRTCGDALHRWESSTTEVLNYRKDGSTFWVQFDIAPLADPDGWFTHWVSIQRDVTARRAREEAAAQELDLIQTILDSLPSQTALLAPDGTILRVNRSWHEVWTAGSADTEPDWSRVNYLDACSFDPRFADEPDDGTADAVRAGIQAVLGGDRRAFALDYSCPVGEEMRWFHLEVHPVDGREGAVVTHLDVTERKAAEDELTHQAHHDGLTGLPNRELLRERLRQALVASRANGTLTAVAFADLDNFKDVNDAYGHLYGDMVLDEVSARLQSAARRHDTVARAGGDEFVVVLPDLPVDWDPAAYLSRLRDVVSAPIQLGVTSVRPSMSVGIVTSPPHRGSADDVLRDADTAMYAAKRAGRDRWQMFNDEVRDSALARALTEDRLAIALEDDLFVLHYQPIVSLTTGVSAGAEALLRLRGPDGSLLYPGEFLATVDSGPIAGAVGSWVLRTALAQQVAWAGAAPDFHIGVNVSPRQLGHGGFPGEVARALDEAGVDARHLVLEITEEALVEAGGAAIAELTQLRDLGVRIAIDDFGTGYSALSYLATLPADIIKIDRSFVAGSSSARGEALLGAIAALATSVGAATIAEGVETAVELDRLLQLGILAALGYYLARPAPAGPVPPTTTAIDAVG
jgi:diguanylate cyclase (GGDEF)-like protein/PAS domain S-box-containing protein